MPRGDRIWFKAAAGFDAFESAREGSFRQYAIAAPDRVIVVQAKTMNSYISTKLPAATRTMSPTRERP